LFPFVIDERSTVQEHLNRSWVELMFLLEDSRGERRLRVSRYDRHCRLRQDRTVVELFVDDVNSAPAHFDAIVERLPLRMETDERGQERWMDIQDSTWKRAYEDGGQNAHEAGKADDVDVIRVQPRDNGLVERLARVVVFVRDNGRWHAGLSGALESASVGFVANDHGDARIDTPISAGVEDRLQIRPAPRNQNPERSTHKDPS
jgi:hypothetical protein